MRQKMIMTFAIVLGLLTFGEWAMAQSAGQSNTPMPMKNSMMQMRQKAMGNTASAQAKPGMMQGGMMGMMSMMKGNGMMGMHDPLFKTLYAYGCPGYLLKVSTPLGLSQEQVQKLENLKLNFKKVAVQNKADRQVATIELKQILNANNPDFKKARAKVNQINALEGKLRVTFLSTIEQGRRVLTPDQLQKLKALSAQAPMTKCKTGMMK
ncbi:MAG: hypothetical protein GXO76_10545 [Calditrichaeota bacterium]|nr:hypothetical protein [Calditrichota bacterium]